MTPKKFADGMKKIEEEYGDDDHEAMDSMAIDAMCKLLKYLGYDEGIEIFENMGT